MSITGINKNNGYVFYRKINLLLNLAHISWKGFYGVKEKRFLLIK